MTMAKEIPVRVEREIGSDGEPTGKTEFVVDELYHYYEPEFDVGPDAAPPGERRLRLP